VSWTGSKSRRSEFAARSRSAAPATGALDHRLALATLCGVLFLTFLDLTVVSVALANIQATLHAGIVQLQWVVNGYALTFASLMLLAGTLGDRIGRRRIMLGGLVVFGAGSLLGALAPNPDVLIGARVLMGVGAAASEPGTLSILRHLYPDEAARARAIGAWAAVSGLALALGPVIGGSLVAIGGWRAVFWFNVAAVGAVTALAARSVPESADPQRSKLDLRGFAAGAVGIGALTFAVTQSETAGYRDPIVLGLFVVAAVALAAFVAIERRATTPLLDPAAFRSPRFSGAMVAAFLLSFGIFSIFFFTALYLAAVAGYSPGRVALEFLPMTGAMVFASVFAGRIVSRRGARLPLVEGSFLGAAGILLSAIALSSTPPSLWLMASLALAGFGFGMSIVPVTAAALGEVPAARSGMAASATNTSRELGAVFGVAVLGALVNANLNGNLADRLRALHIPGNFISIVINAIETGAVPSGVSRGTSGIPAIENRVIQAAYGAFHSGLNEALGVATVGLVAAGAVAAMTMGARRTDAAAPAPRGPDDALTEH
jgi:EmrB/QacA subfamily drug resistance transporter